MRRVMDQIFCETLVFKVPGTAVVDAPAELRRKVTMAVNRADYVKAWCELAGLELIEYDSALILCPEPNLKDFTYVELHSKAYNAKALL